MNKHVWKQWALIVSALILALSLAACGSKDNLGKTVDPAVLSPNPSKAPAASSSAKKTQYPLTVKDATGKEFTFNKAPERIVSVSPAETEKLFALGLGDKIFGVSDFDDFPEAAKSKPKMGGVTKPNQESLIAANADVIFTGVSMKKDTIDKLRESKLNLFQVMPKTVDDVIADILLFGQITDRQEEAEQVVGKMKADRQKVAEAVKGVKEKKKVYIEFSPGWSVGSGEFMDELVGISGGVNVAADNKGWHKISEETIIQKNPGVILFSKNVVDDKTKKPLEQIIKERSGWDKIDAVKNNKVIGMDGNLISRPGPRITDALLEIAKGIYPELVK